MRRAAITGMGVVSPLGIGVPAFRAGLFAGRCAIGPIGGIDTARLSARLAGEVRDFDPAAHLDARRLALLDRVAQFALVAAREAVAQAGLSFTAALAGRTAVILGSGAPGQATQDDNYRRLYGENAPRLHPLTIPRLMASATPSHVTMEFGITGPAFLVSSACASGAHAIAQGLAMIRAGLADVVLAGGAEASLTVGAVKGWEALRVMSNTGCRPFARSRDGMVLAEGAAVFVLEALDHARARRGSEGGSGEGAVILAELAGAGLGSDARDITAPDTGGMARAIAAALADAGLDAAEIAYVNAHGTGTTANDIAETRALRQVFGAQARRLAVSSTKSMIGHALGAAGALELAATVLALAEGVAPPTINYDEPDPACDLDYVPNAARALPMAAALSNSFAFGGLNAVLAVRKMS